jgi:hypothetical protein
VRLLSLDYDPVYGEDETTRSTFGSDISAFDYDVVIWDPERTLGYYTPRYRTGAYRSLPSLSEGKSVEIQADVVRRKNEFADFINSGRVLVVFACPPQACYVDTGERRYSGTGRNRVTTRIVDKFDLLLGLPITEHEFSPAGGSRITFAGDGPLVRVLRKYKAYLRYKAVISDPPGSVLARVTGTDRVVSFVRKSDAGGYLIVLPAVAFQAENDEGSKADDEDETDAEDDESWLPAAHDFQVDLLAAIEQLSGAKTFSRPAWVERYATADQQRLRTEIVKQQKRVETARAKLTKLQQAREAAEARDQLFLGSGRALELEVRSVLELLGGTVTEPEPGRDDWRVSFPEGDAVIEVKGVSKSAAEKHAAQLEKWVAGALEETGVSPKGILVINTWREIPLSERRGEDFPRQMLPYCEKRGHCLLTGLQLFVIRSMVEKDPGRAEHWRKQLLETVGPVGGCDDWRSVIQETAVGEESA